MRWRRRRLAGGALVAPYEAGQSNRVAEGVRLRVTVSSVTVDTLRVTPVGDEAVGVRFVVNLSSQRQTARFTQDFTFIRKDRAVAFLGTGGLGSAFPEPERAALAAKMADRMDG